MIRSLRINNWKGHDELSLSFGEGVNFLIGPNGIGKTSILDAICFALLGNIEATTIYKSMNYKNLIRNPERDMEIALTFCPPENGEYTVTRTHSAMTNRKKGILTLNSSNVTMSWDETTSEILRMYDVNDLFFRRVVLLSEGDTFAYATQPPGEGLTKHIENVLGINRMEILRDNLGGLRRHFEKESRNLRYEVEEVQQSTLEDRKKANELKGKLDTLHTESDDISQQIDALNKQIGVTESGMNSVINLIDQVESVMERWKQTFGDPPENSEFLGAAKALKNSLDNEKINLLTQRDSLRDELSWLKAQVESQSNILELVKPLEEEFTEVACPICKRPLSMEMVTEIKDESIKSLSELEKRKKERDTQLPNIDSKIHDIDIKFQELLGIDSKVRQILEHEPRSLSISVLKSHYSELSEQQNTMQSDAAKLKSQATEKNEEIRNIEQILSELLKRIDEHEKAEMLLSLTRATKGQFVSQLFLNHWNLPWQSNG